MIRIRPATVEDAAILSALYRENREFLTPWEPLRDEAFFTVEGQRRHLDAVVRELREGTGYKCLIEECGQVVGRVSLSGIERGAAQSGHLGYWVGEAANGRGVATQAVRLMIEVAFQQLNLHRVQAEILPQNIGSQKVLQRNNFQRIGFAPKFLKIAGKWQDHILFQRINTSSDEPGS